MNREKLQGSRNRSAAAVAHAGADGVPAAASLGSLVWFALSSMLGWVVLCGSHQRFGWNSMEWPSARLPFGTSGIVWLHLLAALPAAWMMVGFVRDWLGDGWWARQSRFVTAGSCIILAGGWGWWTIRRGGAVPGWHASLDATAHAALRVGWCLIWQTLWVAALRLGTSARALSSGEALPSGGRGVAALLLTLVLAWAVPQAYVHTVVRREAVAATRHLQEQRYRLAWANVQRLRDLASREPIGSQGPSEIATMLDNHRRELLRAVQQPLPADVDEATRLQRAIQLQQLGVWDDAVAMLEPLVPHDPRAAWQMVLLFEERGQLADSVALSEQLWERLAGREDPQAARLQAQLLVKWAHNLRRLQRYDDAEGVLRRAWEDCPEQQDLVDFELGYHYEQAGFHGRARYHYERAAVVGTAAEAQARAALEALEDVPSSCLPRPAYGF